MTKVREALSNNEGGGNSWWNWFVGMSNQAVASGMVLVQYSFVYGRQIGWFVVTTGMITALPLIFEVKREAMMEEMERLQIGAALQEGKTPQELAMSGLTSAVEPAVLK